MTRPKSGKANRRGDRTPPARPAGGAAQRRVDAVASISQEANPPVDDGKPEHRIIRYLSGVTPILAAIAAGLLVIAAAIGALDQFQDASNDEATSYVAPIVRFETPADDGEIDACDEFAITGYADSHTATVPAYIGIEKMSNKFIWSTKELQPNENGWFEVSLELPLPEGDFQVVVMSARNAEMAELLRRAAVAGPGQAIPRPASADALTSERTIVHATC